MAHDKKHGHGKKKGAKTGKPESTLRFVGTFLSQAVADLFGEATRALKRKKIEALRTAQAAAP